MQSIVVDFTDRVGLSAGAHLRAEIERLGLDQGAVADATGVSRQTINNVVNDRHKISRTLAAKLGRLTGRHSDYWLRSRFPVLQTKIEPPDAGTPAQAGAPDSEIGTNAFGIAILVNHQIIRAIRNGVIGVDPFDERNVQRASLDLTLDDFVITTDGEERNIGDGQTFSLGGRQAVNVRTRESIEFPLDYVGRVGAMTQLAKFGVMMSHGFQVDPGFKGHLQFCLFNAGGNPFRLRSGLPIISLEIARLASTPSTGDEPANENRWPDDRDDVLETFRESARSGCYQIVRDLLKSHVQAYAGTQRVTARIPRLKIEIVDSTEEAAAENAIRSALATLKEIRTASDPTVELSGGYATFFDEVSDGLCLTSEQAQAIVSALGFEKTDPGKIVRLRSGEKIVLRLPPGSAKITLKNLAEQLGENPQDLILMMAESRS